MRRSWTTRCFEHRAYHPVIVVLGTRGRVIRDEIARGNHQRAHRMFWHRQKDLLRLMLEIFDHNGQTRWKLCRVIREQSCTWCSSVEFEGITLLCHSNHKENHLKINARIRTRLWNENSNTNARTQVQQRGTQLHWGSAFGSQQSTVEPEEWWQ